MEWAYMEPGVIEKMVLTTTSPRESAWGIAIHTAQRLSIEADPTWKDHSEKAGAKGLKAARAIGMLTYRNYEQFSKTQTDDDHGKLDDYKASSYIHYQGDKLVSRFNVYSYWLLTKAMDSHNVSRGRDKMEEVLASIKTKALVIGISSDFLCPVAEQQFLAQHLANAYYKELESPFGHDGFLVEGEKIGKAITDFLSKNS
jgi:homoserine O-acetyltransferase